jgi:hypothetical protein
MNLDIKGFGIGFVAGLATAAVLPVVLPAFAEAGRPLAKALLKHTLLGMHRLRVSAARASESLEDFLAEVRAEVERELAKNEAAPAPTASPDRAGTTSEVMPDAKVYS